MPVATVRQTDLQSRPKKGQSYTYQAYSKLQPKSRIRVRPTQTFIIQGLPENDCSCTIVLHNERTIGQTRFWRELKYVHKACPHHGGGKVECSYDYAH